MRRNMGTLLLLGGCSGERLAEWLDCDRSALRKKYSNDLESLSTSLAISAKITMLYGRNGNCPIRQFSSAIMLKIKDCRTYRPLRFLH